MNDGQIDRLDHLDRRFDGIETRLERIEQTLGREVELRAQLAHSEESRRQLAEQTSYLIELLGETRTELRQLRAERAQRQPGPADGPG